MRNDFDLVLNEYDFYNQLTTKMQTELVKHTFYKFLNLFQPVFKGCNETFVNRIVLSLRYISFEHGMLVQSANSYCHDVYFIRKGSIAVVESSCYKDPILVYGPGGFFNMY